MRRRVVVGHDAVADGVVTARPRWSPGRHQHNHRHSSPCGRSGPAKRGSTRDQHHGQLPDHGRDQTGQRPPHRCRQAFRGELDIEAHARDDEQGDDGKEGQAGRLAAAGASPPANRALPTGSLGQGCRQQVKAHPGPSWQRRNHPAVVMRSSSARSWTATCGVASGGRVRPPVTDSEPGTTGMQTPNTAGSIA
jgi:hypothetical protein